jgi:hypothetical protein
MTTTEVRERPILFSGPMIRAILEGRKTKARRVVKPQPPENGKPVAFWYGWPGVAPCGERNNTLTSPWRPGDRLWVKEAWQAWAEFDEVDADGIPADARTRLNYPADGNLWDARKRHSRFMPRWASRITLEITDVRVERVQEISDSDCETEGLEPTPGHLQFAHRHAFMTLWDRINGPRGYGWDANPWVWVLTFRRVEGDL